MAGLQPLRALAGDVSIRPRQEEGQPVKKLLSVGLVGLEVGIGQAAEHALAGAAIAQSATEACEWPTDLDAVTAAPENHEVLLEDEHVRVLDVTVGPGEREEAHTRCLPSVI
jgi:hypothetical protein